MVQFKSNLKMEEPPVKSTEKQEQNTVNFELSKQSLETLIDGLLKIKSQLSTLNK